jgi:hypothetical protein
MTRRTTNLETWRQRGDVDYVRLEARPTRRRADESNVVAVRLDFIPPGDWGAAEAFQVLIDTYLAVEGEADCRAFYQALAWFCKTWRRHLPLTDDGDLDGRA